MSDTDAKAPRDPVDAARWDAVEEATELLHEERFREALVLLRDVLKADSENAYAFYFSGVALFEVGELEPARDAYRACLRVAPKHLGARVALTHVLRALGDLKGAMQEAQVALAQAPDDGEVLHATGLVYLARGDHVAAKKFLKAFLDTNPEFEVAAEVSGMIELIDREGELS